MTSPDPNHPRVGCGAAILRGGALLLVLRNRQPEAGHWGLPGGKVDWGEDTRTTCAREIAEELGLTITPGRLLCVADTIDLGDGRHWVAPVYLVEDCVGEPAVLEPEALGGCGWFPLDALPSPLTAATRAALDALEALATPTFRASPAITLRPYAPGEDAALAQLWFESWSSNGFEGPQDIREQLIDRVPRELAGRWDVTVAEADGRLLGFLALAVQEERLDQLFIAPDAQGRGVGRALFDFAVQRFPDGFWLTTQTENRRACAFYERRGMVLDRIEDDRVFYRLAPGPTP